jgi:hypothetical protein
MPRSIIEEPKLHQIVSGIADGIRTLQAGAGMNLRAVVVLLHHETGLSMRTINQVLEGLGEIRQKFLEDNATAQQQAKR